MFDNTKVFFDEAEELLNVIEQAALSLDAGDSEELINQLFRAFHTIKGSSAMCGLDAISGFTHHLETLLDRVRAGEVPVSQALIDLVLKSERHIRELLIFERGGPAVSPEAGPGLIAEIVELSGNSTPAAPHPAQSAPPPAPPVEAKEQAWRIRFRPDPSLLACGGNPVALWRELASLGECDLDADTSEVPDLEHIKPDTCYLSWTAKLKTSAGENAVRDVFIFVEFGSNLEVERIADLHSDDEPVRMVAKPSLGRAGAGEPEAPESNNPDPPAASIARRSASQPKESTVRVPSDRLDRLVNLVGELVMNQSRLVRAATMTGASELTNPVQELDRLVAELRDDVLSIRMLPIGTIFGRFRRLVHDLSAELGKEVDLVTEGAETELDKSILDQLGDPLVHCLRNCLDHGVEPPVEREANGKPHRATIRLSASHTGSNVVITIQDDGRGIDRAAVKAKAIEKQLIGADAVLGDKDIFNLILLPGFSTARQVTTVSGRGVGMDAVKRQVDALRGSLSLSSEVGRGTRVTITLPLTLAIIDGLLVQIANDQFIIPMAAVTENVELTRAERAGKNGRNVIAVRGELVSYIDLREMFRMRGDRPVIEKVVIVQQEGDRVGLIVDRVLGTHQTVIQSLGRFFKSIEVVSGATIMGDGRVALILDTARLVHAANEDRREQSSSPALERVFA